MSNKQANFKENNSFYNNRGGILQSILFILVINLVFLPYSGTVKADKETVLKNKIININKSFAVLSKENKIVMKSEKSDLELKSKRKIAWSKRYAMTAYNSDVAQCDASPCITASGFNVCEHGIEDTVAVNFLKFGTEIRVPELFGDRVFTVRDRMNKRYTNRVDVWLLSHDNAVDFGVKYPLIEVLE